MFWSVLKFELRYHLTRPLTYLFLAVLGILTFAFAATDAVQVAGAGAQIKRNAPSVITVLFAISTLVGQVILTAVVGTAVLRDYQYQTHELLFATPITKRAYLGGRFAGAFLVMVVIHLGIPLGSMLGAAMPWVDRTELLPFRLATYVQPFFAFVLPSVLLTSAIFFAVGALTRSLFAIYTQGIFLLVGYSIAGAVITDLENETLGSLLDPYGLTALTRLTRYWTIAEQNSQLVPVTGVILANRLLWIAVAVLLLGLTYALFRFRSAPPSLRRRQRRRTTAEPASAPAPALPPPIPHLRYDLAASWRQFVSVARLTFLSVVRDLVFVAIVTIGIVNMVMGAWFADSLYGVTVWPVTYILAEGLGNNFSVYYLILVTIYSGELIWKERQLRMDQIADALPTRTGVTMLGKLTGLTLVWAVLLGILIVAGIAVQTLKGYYNYELGLYLRYLYGTVLPTIVQLTVLGFLVHSLVNQKFVGHVVMIVLFIGSLVLNRLGVEHQLFHYSETYDFVYSDMNGFGPFVSGITWVTVYWTGVAIVLGVLALLLWLRGTDTAWRTRLRRAGGRWRRPVPALAILGLLVAIGAGSVVYYNTNVRNPYETTRDRRRQRADYERRYKKLEKLRQPRLVDVEARADLVPERRAFGLSGTFTYVNRDSSPMDTVVVSVRPELAIDSMIWDRPARTLESDSALGTRIQRLESPLAPGDTLRLRYRARWVERGFTNAGVNTDIVSNGAFINSQYYPALGYQRAFEVSGEDDRKKEKLPPKQRMPSINNEAARANSYLGEHSDWIGFRATVSTAPDQIAIAPGYLVREYQEGGRRVFEYRMDRPILNFYSFVSARYAVKRDTWNGVSLEIYYHPGHEYDLDRMMESMKASLDYFSTHFSPYQFRQVRILEFPRYAGFAQAFPNTVPYSESIGFILRVRDRDDDLDMPFYVTAHEVGHQWWAHQVIGANMQGSTLMSEGLANYSALTVMEKRYGPTRLKKFLANELDRYLFGRSSETQKELPLELVENQGYIHYNKGSLVLFALRDLIGEDSMNAALSRYLADKAFQQAPFTTSREFLGYLDQVTPDSVKYALDDFFRTITLWDFRVEDASATPSGDGAHRVRIRTSIKKLRADSLGNQTEIPIRDLVDVGVFGEREKGNALGKPLYLAKHWITPSDTTFEILVKGEPRRAGVDPYNKLVDRVPRDNVREVRRQ